MMTRAAMQCHYTAQQPLISTLADALQLRKRQAADDNYQKTFTKTKAVISAALKSAAKASNTTYDEAELLKAFSRFEAASSEEHKTGKPLERLWVELQCK
jgi:Tfp pilus assembly protein PilV